MANTDIIAAIATPPGRGGIGVVRVSGQNLQSLARMILGYVPQQRYASLSTFHDENGLLIDQGIALYFPAPHSYTGEDVLELQGHGGPVIMNLLLSCCVAAGARLAQPGEFTLRAFLNDKLDLAQAESVVDIINASSAEAVRCAMRSLQGEFSTTIHVLVQAIIDLRMMIEATLDFPEDEIDFLQYTDLPSRLNDISMRLECVLTSAQQGSLFREGGYVVLVGQPNVGKSSLMNRLTGEETTIVSEISGTTRDAVCQTINLTGVPVHLIDTAGLRETEDPVEKIGIARTRAAIEKANLALLLIDCRRGAAAEDWAILNSLPAGLPVIRVFNKVDLLNEPPRVKSERSGLEIYLSAKTGAGVDLLREKLQESMGWLPYSAGEGVFMARRRHLQALAETKEHLEKALEVTRNENQPELLAEELRLAQLALSSITGEFSADALLGEIFSGFCVGK